jgi:hypothetical protein
MANYESPDYQIILTEGNFEIRTYEAFYMVTYEKSQNAQTNLSGRNSAFGTLFRYISNENASREKISMTVPVIMESEQDQLKMAFVVPKEKWDAIPKPLDPNLKITQFDAGKYGVLSYRGSWSSDKEQQKAEELRAWVEKKGYSVTSGYKMAVYNGPFVPALFRHNEILVKVA